jgi:hypothetical protein
VEKFDVVLINLHDQIDYDRCNLIIILEEIDDLYPASISFPTYTRLLYLNYISLSELSYSIKEYFLLKDVLIHKF